MRRMSLSGLTDTHRAYLFRHLRPLSSEIERAGEVRNEKLHLVRRLFTAWSSGTRTDALCRSSLVCLPQSPIGSLSWFHRICRVVGCSPSYSVQVEIHW